MAVAYLSSHVPKELHDLKPNRLLYPGLGRDVWVPFGILDATHVTAWDEIDEHVIPVGWKASARQRLYGYAVLLTNDLLSMFAKIKRTQYDEAKNMFTIEFTWEKKRRSLTVFVQNYDQVKVFPRADGLLFGGTMKASTEQRMIQQSGADYGMEEGVEVVYPSSMQEFLDKWIVIDNLAYNLKACEKQIREGYQAMMKEDSPNNFLRVHHTTLPVQNK